MKNKLALLLPIRCIMFVIIFVVGAALTKKELGDISNWWSIIASAINIITILILVGVAKKQKSTYFEMINYKKGASKPGQVVGVTFLILLIGMTGMYLAGFICYGVIPYAAPMLIAPIPVALAIINIFILPVTTALAEDGLYLGIGVNSIDNKVMAVIAPAFFFALQHSFIPTLWDVRYIVYRFISFLPLTILLCIYYQKKKNPLPIMVGHAIIDVATVVQILATSTVPGFYEMMCNAAL